MSTNSIKKTTEVLTKLGIILSDENSFKRLHELRTQKNQLSNYLTKAERYKNLISQVTYEKVRKDYQDRLQEISIELEGKEKQLKGEWDLLLRKRDELVEIVRPLALAFEELKFRYMVGEYTKEAFLVLASDKMELLKDYKEQLLALSERLSFYRLVLNIQEESVEPTASIPLEIENFEVPPEESYEPSFQPVEEASTSLQDTASISLEGEEFEFNFDTLKGESPEENELAEARLNPLDEEMDLGLETDHERAFLILKHEGKEDESFLIAPNTSITIGRAKDTTLRIDEDTISRYHTKVSHENGQYIVRDLGSSNGTFVNGKKVTEQILKNNDLIVLGGKVKFLFTKS